MKFFISRPSHSRGASSLRYLDPEKNVLINAECKDLLIGSAARIQRRAQPENYEWLIAALDECCLPAASAASYNIPETTINESAS